MRCIKCGSGVGEYAKFCVNCGTKIESEKSGSKESNEKTKKEEKSSGTSKRKRIIYSMGIVLLVGLVCFGGMKFWYVSKNNANMQDDKAVYTEEEWWSEEVQYELKDSDVHGTTTISVSAPDFCLLTKELLDEGKDVTKENLMEAMKDTPVNTKAYTIMVEDTAEDAIKEAFYEQVIYELMIEAIKNMEYTEEWSVEE